MQIGHQAKPDVPIPGDRTPAIARCKELDVFGGQWRISLRTLARPTVADQNDPTWIREELRTTAGSSAVLIGDCASAGSPVSIGCLLVENQPREHIPCVRPALWRWPL